MHALYMHVQACHYIYMSRRYATDETKIEIFSILQSPFYLGQLGLKIITIKVYITQNYRI
jgi:hypothetical protein